MTAPTPAVLTAMVAERDYEVVEFLEYDAHLAACRGDLVRAAAYRYAAERFADLVAAHRGRSAAPTDPAA